MIADLAASVTTSSGLLRRTTLNIWRAARSAPMDTSGLAAPKSKPSQFAATKSSGAVARAEWLSKMNQL
jgi:hypothetical protein